MNIFVLAAEASGDALGADLIRSLKAQADPTLTLSGIGGSAMAREGVSSDFDISELSILGFIEGIKAYPKVVALADMATDLICDANPDAVVLIDSWGFTLRVAQRLQKRAPHIKRIKLVGPQVWATRPERAKTLAAAVDHLLCIHAFEAPFYEPYGLPVTVIGNPALGRDYPVDVDAFRTKHKLTPDTQTIIMLPGSRPSEILKTAPTLAAATGHLLEAKPDRRAFVVVAPEVADLVQEQAGSVWPSGLELITDPEDKYSAMASGDVGLVCSGTVATEAAMQGLPIAVAYRLAWLTWFLADTFLYKADHITLFNVAAGARVAPEFVQGELTEDNLIAFAENLLCDEAARHQQIQDQFDALDAMGRGKKPAAEIAAGAILDLLRM